MIQKTKKFPLAIWIFMGLILGILAGIALMKTPEIAVQYIKPFGTLFLNLVKFIVVPIVLFSIMSGVISMKDIRKVGKIGIRTVVFYMTTTAIAVVIGLTFANVFKGTFGQISTSGLEYTAKEAPGFITTIINIFPSNIIDPMSDANMLQVIVTALFFGFAVITVGEKGKAFADFVESANAVSMIIMDTIIKFSPVGVFCLITPVVAENGASILGNLLTVLVVAYGAYFIHMAVVYSVAIKAFAQMSPLKFFSGMMPAIMMAFSSASSVGTLPLNLECTEKMGAKKDVASFVLPLGATINMDGTAIYQGVCAIFIASCFGIDLTLSQQIAIILTATLASIGTAGVPGAGMIMLAMVLQSVNLPIEGIALVAGIDRIFDMGRTVVNITGDAACTLIVSKAEDKNG
ncbi:dicarboxylate/amino acid:cation symporter [Anaerotignum sp. MB30-C6]|uniref:dicarboxylate/amino acid:cation symporter n=1 Tax=Anaerotignum sp. MB30-C6 TaxID=3070814 RepID=UPI0027DE7EC6|nr:dicarboxylate/amino acid:cation symporter [Anaerotignum sp. MB30-C6]WMI81022.1 dicarboxylate/amino acid:cation symporter [Anaerotignum sp. MB30-C6]